MRNGGRCPDSIENANNESSLINSPVDLHDARSKRRVASVRISSRNYDERAHALGYRCAEENVIERKNDGI